MKEPQGNTTSNSSDPYLRGLTMPQRLAVKVVPDVLDQARDNAELPRSKGKKLTREGCMNLNSEDLKPEVDHNTRIAQSYYDDTCRC